MPPTENERLLSEHQPNAVRARLLVPLRRRRYQTLYLAALMAASQHLQLYRGPSVLASSGEYLI
ncbi:hypothetical protein MspRI1_22410 [Marinobacter sp. RI1]